ncbi:MAG: dehydrogenase [Pseudomonadota bacterium]
MRVFSAEELRRAFDFQTLIDALECGHRAGRPQLADTLLGQHYMVRSAHSGAGLIGSKLITIFPDNPNTGSLPSIQAAIVLFDGTDGQPRALLDATELTYWKTAADSALGSRMLSREDAETLVVFGAGGLAPWLVRAHCVVRPSLKRALVWNRTSGRAEAMADELSQDGMSVEVASDPETAVRRADIVTTATMATKPVLHGDWLRAGAHVDLVGGFSEETREADDAVFSRGTVFVDCMESALDGVGDIDGPLQSGAISKEDLLGDLFDLVPGTVGGRQSADEITVFKNAGGAHLDLMVAAALVERIEAGAS